MKNFQFDNKKVAVLGMGIEGLALVDFLLDKACKITILDRSSEVELLEKLSGEEKTKFDQIIKNNNIDKVLGDDYMENLGPFDIIFRSPGISYYNSKIQDAKKSGTLISSQIKLFFDLCPCKIIGVTGTKGKGTTASLIYEILKKNKEEQPNSQQNIYLAGNIGYPAITLIPKLKNDDVVILELSSFQLMDLEKSPHVAVVTNLSVDHLDYHRDVEEYRGAKESIVKYQDKKDFAILNRNSTFNSSVLELIKSSIKYFPNQNKDDAIISNNSVILDPENRNIKICDKSGIELFGNHNLENIAAAVLASDLLRINTETIKKVVSGFKGLPHRIEFVNTISGVKFVNDSFATNPEPTMAAIASFVENKILILGGSKKGANFSSLAQKICNSNIKGVVLIGDESKSIEQALIASSYSGIIKKGLSDIDKIVGAAFEIASKGDVVILSPACASFGLFKNYKDRGEKFKDAVLKLKINYESS